MRFSIIVPVYKVEKYLEQCVDSILEQDHHSFELILVDDGSPDSCPQLCDSYAQQDSRVIVVHKENGGLSDARNAGIRMARGEYLLFVDSDDYWNEPKVLTKIEEKLALYPVDIVQFGQEMYYQAERKITRGPQRNMSQYDGLQPDVVINKLVSRGELSISACSMAISRKFIVNHELYFHKGIKTEDLEWAIRLFLNMPTWAFADEYFYVYRMQRAGSITATIDYKHLCDYCWILEQSVARVESADEKIKQPLMSYMMYHMLIASALVYRVKPSAEQRREILGRLKKICRGNITRYTMNHKVKLASVVYCLCGFTMMTKALGFYLNNRGR